ncbi:MAG: arginine--tRNA ligase [Candidatus Magasanikbacteria bacterium RIFCSPHIGHO2_01_FULL_41_23]|uniref:Arginine--tRNA ligase n=1 Tax=Candidatus Magasanikbacteria bacterium RIFCSPLOWO2_01_FULL_40_15 TaxID=1798686 RepID=A0A1F6N4D4_9BACT|nr:MAG: arginine--tRNA ligase [Candidatus Magasanikbacteria bacterium RIFCSPHIGHO2_01_FULL_41_23]OGH66778.1 MAG: arginine--tRNA ligase [Candidatus Magasanikbacteria bacterium RIFCSPHIGHO2_02_FULL_41_35]OGH74576.1 MAG: arginine--tRNA ligase [Candidatus Magasanikbacteria bacterium RIFCSPHIGHO2_12_FULL_41_16]OGH78865.1 MAG: arginine--tRNA ligase [Candidatus Magasanikbacteria bacterium RIFCSPLOWO2_01_FULL_40_15]
MIQEIKKNIIDLLTAAGVMGDIELSSPPKPEMGDFAFACFGIAKEKGENPATAAKNLVEKISPPVDGEEDLIVKVQAFGPYVNFFVDSQELAKTVLKNILENKKFGTHTFGQGQTILVEYACPNPMKVFHLGHLRNLITGEAMARILENAGYDVKRVNYQGDVGMHIAKSLWGINQMNDVFASMKNKSVEEQVAFLGKAYALGATKFEEDAATQAEILEYNRKIYEHDWEIQDVYQTARVWSLEYFDTIYTKLGTRFDRLYFESEVFNEGKKMVLDGLEKGIFKKSDGAIIFPGSECGLHDRVFINSQGFPTYEAKDLGLAKLHFTEYKPDKVIHVVGKEQTEYFKVVFQALSVILPKTKDKELHLVGGYLQLKGDEKMSSRKGNVISGDELVMSVENNVRKIMAERDIQHKEFIVNKVSIAALKYTMLRVNASEDMAFDVQESVSISGDSGSYVLYIVTRIRSLLVKAGVLPNSIELNVSVKIPEEIGAEEKQLLLVLARFSEVTQQAVNEFNPSVITKYVFALAQAFNVFYQTCSVLDAATEQKQFRLYLAQAVARVMTDGLYLLGIETVEEM